MKGQTQALTAVLITSVTVGAIATAYVWGSPLLEKRQSRAELDAVETDVKDIHEKIISVSKGGVGTTASVEIDVKDGRVEIDSDRDSINVITGASSSPYPKGTWTLIKGNSLQNTSIGTGSYGIKSEDLPGIIAVKAAAAPGATVINYKVEFRNLYTETPTGAELTKIDLNSTGRTTSSGTTTLLISNVGTRTDRIGVTTGEKFKREKKVIEIDIK